MTTSPSLTAQLRLPGQVAAPDGPVDMFMMYVFHFGFRRDLRRFQTAVPATPVTDTAAWQALDRRWRGFGGILRSHHEHEDDYLWPLLLERVDAAGDTAAQRVLAEMEAEHEEIDPLLAACGQGFAALAGGGTEDDRAALSVRLTATAQSLDRHLGHEESAAMDILQRYLTPADWTATEDKMKERPTWAFLTFNVPWAGSQVPAAEMADILRRLPAPFRVLRALTQGRFDRREKRIFRYPR